MDGHYPHPRPLFIYIYIYIYIFIYIYIYVCICGGDINVDRRFKRKTDEKVDVGRPAQNRVLSMN